MSKERSIRMLEGELPPLDGRKRPLCRRIRSGGNGDRRTMKIRVSRKLRSGQEPSTEILRIRTILQEMRRAYNRLTGLGDYLVDQKLASIMARKPSIGSLGKQDMCALNYDLAKLVASIFGATVAQEAYEHIGAYISERF